MSKFNYNQITPGYYDRVYRRHKGIQSRWHHKKFAAVEAALPETGLHLDIGCGPGTFIGNLSKGKDLDSLGIDIAHHQIEYATSNYSSENRHFQLCDIFDLDPSCSQYDVITFVEVLEHLQKPKAIQMLSHAKKLLKKSGSIIITTPNYSSAWPAVERIVNLLGDVKYDDQHINKYTSVSLHEDLIQCGLRPLEISSFMSFSPFLAAMNWDLSKALSRSEHYTKRRLCMGMLLLAVAKY